MIHPSHQLNLALNNFGLLPPNSKSAKYQNLASTPHLGLLDRIKIILNPGSYYSELNQLYPYHNVISKANETFHEDEENATKNGLLISTISIFALFQAARRGVVLPLLNQYGNFFHTHRIFRHYIWAAVLPITLLHLKVHWDNRTDLFHFWSVHARRIQRGVFTDPQGTQYPDELLPFNVSRSWRSPLTLPLDQQNKLANETTLENARDYENPEFEAVDLGEETNAAEGEGEGEEEEE